MGSKELEVVYSTDLRALQVSCKFAICTVFNTWRGIADVAGGMAPAEYATPLQPPGPAHSSPRAVCARLPALPARGARGNRCNEQPLMRYVSSKCRTLWHAIGLRLMSHHDRAIATDRALTWGGGNTNRRYPIDRGQIPRDTTSSDQGWKSPHASYGDDHHAGKDTGL